MQLEHLAVRNLRIIQETDFHPGPGINVVVGANGSGKTSLLEAVYFLSRTRSFRTNRVGDLLSRRASLLAVEGDVRTASGGAVRAEVRRMAGELRVVIGGRPAGRAADLARLLPVAVSLPQSTGLLEGAPRERRRLLDWLVFHVEPGFLEAWQAYHRVMRQRNAALRGGDGSVAAWEARLGAPAARLAAMRERAVGELERQFEALSAGLLPEPLRVHYEPGWDPAQDLGAAVAERREEDRAAGFTLLGPHRMDLRLEQDGRNASRTLSRGQAKLAVVALTGALVRTVAASRGETPLFLLDDFGAELDRWHAGRLAALVGRIGGQAFVTTTDARLAGHWELPEARVFHVEQGVIRQDSAGACMV